MEVPLPSVFISATTKDLRACREQICTALQKIGCTPVVQDTFPPSGVAVTAMLRDKIAPCRSVIHVAGLCYGAEPRERAPDEPRHSYTQQEYHLARELAKPVYTFVCLDGFPYLKHDPESEEHRALQQTHRDALQQRAELYYKVRNLDELLMLVLAVPDGREAVAKIARDLGVKVAAQEKELQKTRGWLKYVGAAAVAALVAIGLFLWWKHERDRRAEERDKQQQQLAEDADARGKRMEAKLSELEKQLASATPLTGQLITEDGRAITSEEGCPLLVEGVSPADSLAARRAEKAKELGISVEQLKEAIGKEGADVRQLLARIEKEREDAATKAELWTALKRDALKKLGDTEYATGHYREAIRHHREAHALYDRSKEPLLLATAARDLSVSLWQQGQGEALGQQVLEIRERTLGKEHPITLLTLNNLATALSDNGDSAGAELLYRRALEVQERTLGKEHLDTLATMNNLAALLRANGDTAGAEPLFRRALEATERTLGKEHPDTLGSVNNLANLLYTKGDSPGAQPLYRRARQAMAGAEKSLPKGHPRRLDYERHLADLIEQSKE